jgi:fumarate hydratase class II
VKKAAAIVNTAAGRLPAWKGELIERVCDEVISGALDTEFQRTGEGFLTLVPRAVAAALGGAR